MAVTAIVPEQLVTNTRSADKSVADATVATTPADGWSIALGANAVTEKLILFWSADATGDTVTILAGDNPPSLLAPLGNLAIVLAASDERMVILDAGRFLHDDNTVKATCVDAGTGLRAFLLPKGIGGGSGVA